MMMMMIKIISDLKRNAKQNKTVLLKHRDKLSFVYANDTLLTSILSFSLFLISEEDRLYK